MSKKSKMGTHCGSLSKPYTRGKISHHSESKHPRFFAAKLEKNEPVVNPLTQLALVVTVLEAVMRAPR